MKISILRVLTFCLLLSPMACSSRSTKTDLASNDASSDSAGNANTIRRGLSGSTGFGYDVAHLPPEQGEKWNVDSDPQRVETVYRALSTFLTKRDVTRRDPKSKDETNRIFHPKQHGCVKASFDVPAALPADITSAKVRLLPDRLRFGIFRSEGLHDAWVRFSNGDPGGENAPDIALDIRGMAVKLINVEGTPNGSQDFVMCTGKEFFAKGVNDYVGLNLVGTGTNLQKIGALLGALATEPFATTVLDDVKYLEKAKTIRPSPLETDFYSAVPYKLGNNEEMKFSAEYCRRNGNHAIPEKKTARANYLREILTSTVAERETCFDFYVQIRNKNQGAKIEDPRQPWDENKSPKFYAARIRVLQDPDIHANEAGFERDNFCENLSFDPWHTLPETRPLGEMGRMRGLLYRRMSMVRHTQNGTVDAGTLAAPEPKSLSHPCEGEGAILCKQPRH